MRASCCFIEPSCRKVEICNPYPPGKTDRALSGKMTATSSSLRFSGCFVTLLIWAGCTSVVCLVDEKLTAQPTIDTTHGDIPLPLSFACGTNAHSCMEYCSICQQYFGAPTMVCLHTLLEHMCIPKFDNAMTSMKSPNWCTWGNVSNYYSNLSHCTEEISDCLMIPWPNPLVEQTFVDIHSRFFKECPSEELSDPPPVIVMALVITPICLIPLMVSLVVLKTKNGDGSS
ncbi:receptor activity-modifying protein 2 isoform X1 [Pseudochaenichthys georgianus]|uniref:receptor activity-modifying protein 2 isoform X1 n=1 Tax=Pseudochaenichthys georgianus TaxID=52239 RepID=UPI001469FDA8|nr:receptor activity-modifying protein 2 isoform X3 [Pseudochaenichthys georgianus]